MTFFDFCDRKFQNISIALSKEFTIARDSEIKALHSLLNVQRAFFKWVCYPKVLVLFFLTKLGFLPVPPSPIADARKAQEEAKKKAAEEAAAALAAKLEAPPTVEAAANAPVLSDQKV